MNFQDALNEFSARVSTLKDNISTEDRKSVV